MNAPRLAIASMILAGAAAVVVAAQHSVEAAAPAVPPYAPGLGDFMTAYVQPHHTKLWLAGKAGDWALAAYEADELGETFDDVETYQAVWKGVPVAKLVDSILRPAIKQVQSAIALKNPDAFRNAYAGLTAACNACHVTAQHDFVHIVIPSGNPFPDQSFSGR